MKMNKRQLRNLSLESEVSAKTMHNILAERKQAPTARQYELMQVLFAISNVSKRLANSMEKAGIKKIHLGESDKL